MRIFTRWLAAAAVFACLGGDARRAAADVLQPVVTESIEVNGPTTSFNAPPFEGLIRNLSGSVEDRAIVEFDLRPEASLPLTGATLAFGIGVNNAFGGPVRNFDVSVFSATGSPDLADFSAPATFVQQVSFQVSDGGGTFSLDLLPEINTLFGDHGGILGVRVEAIDAQSAPSILGGATLTIATVPEPASLALIGIGLIAVVGLRRRGRG